MRIFRAKIRKQRSCSTQRLDRYFAISPTQFDAQRLITPGIARILVHSSNCQSAARSNENFPSLLRFACQVLLPFARHRCAESHRTLLRLALIGTNYSVYVSRDRTNSLAISWFKRKFALTPISLTRASTLRTKLNRSTEWLLEFPSRSIPSRVPSLFLSFSPCRARSFTLGNFTF